MRKVRPLAERFAEKVDKSAPGCWIWISTKLSPNGYGVMSCGSRGSRKTAHRVSWEIHHGAVPTNMFVLHRCDNCFCVNPEHLFLGTQADNMADKKAKGRTSHLATRGNAKITEIQAAEIVRLRRTGSTRRELASMYGLSPNTIKKIWARKIWGHVKIDQGLTP